MVGVKISPVNMEDRKKLGIRAGDTIRVWQKIQEKDKTRLQAFEGLVLATKHGSEPGATFTVRRVASGVGMEKIFPLYSPMIDKIEIIKRSKVRRSKLYYIREKAAKEIKRQMRHMTMVNLSTSSQKDDEAEEEPAEDVVTNEDGEAPEQTEENPKEKEDNPKTGGDTDAEADKKE
ncbi:50S ribosomal protein L19 [Patescibacteria group bacterium]|nr:50S ribosomal protein L19 [Patescibacteria group bacterium]